MRQGVDVVLRKGRVGEEEEGKDKDFKDPKDLKDLKDLKVPKVNFFQIVPLSFHPLVKTLFLPFKKSSYLCILNLQR
jgi:hypothetical protein